MKIFIWVFLSIFCLSGTGLEAKEFSAEEVYEDTSSHVVLIISKEEGKTGKAGAGTIIRKDGVVLTNSHVIYNRKKQAVYSKIVVFLKPDNVTGSMAKDLEHRYQAKVAAYSEKLDLAVLQIIDPPKNLGEVRLADPLEVKIGQEVVAIGHPEQGGLWTLSVGRISGTINDYSGIRGKHVFQTDTSINRGNSGGPLLDNRGFLVAVNSNIARLGQNGIPITGVNFAIKSSVARDWLEDQGQSFSYGQSVSAELKPVEESAIKEDIKEAKEFKPEITEKKTDVKKTELEEVPPESLEKILTPKKPYNYEDLIKSTEEELDDLMDMMKDSLKRRQSR